MLNDVTYLISILSVEAVHSIYVGYLVIRFTVCEWREVVMRGYGDKLMFLVCYISTDRTCLCSL
jgi:hypothetical protein